MGDTSNIKLAPKLYGDPVRPLLDLYDFTQKYPEKSIKEHILERIRYLETIEKSNKNASEQTKKILKGTYEAIDKHVTDGEIVGTLKYMKPYLDVLAINIRDEKIETLKPWLNVDVGTTIKYILGIYQTENELKARDAVFYPNTGNQRINTLINVVADSSLIETHIYHNVENPNGLYEAQQKFLDSQTNSKTEPKGPRVTDAEEPTPGVGLLSIGDNSLAATNEQQPSPVPAKAGSR